MPNIDLSAQHTHHTPTTVGAKHLGKKYKNCPMMKTQMLRPTPTTNPPRTNRHAIAIGRSIAISDLSSIQLFIAAMLRPYTQLSIRPKRSMTVSIFETSIEIFLFSVIIFIND